MDAQQNRRGFILPLTVILVLVLSFSGMGFVQLDFHERAQAVSNISNHDAFYLANAGIERAREAFKIPLLAASWTGVLEDPSQTDSTYPPDLCPFGAQRGCVIPPFGLSVTASDSPLPPPFSGTFVSDPSGRYEVRAYNNAENPATCPGPQTTDCDEQLVLRARGTVRGQVKVIEVTVLTTSSGNLITCAIEPCASKANGDPQPCNSITTPSCLPMEGREPGISAIPPPDFPFTNSQNYYRVEPAASPVKQQTNFPNLLQFYQHLSGNIDLDPEDNTYYFVDGDVTLQNDTATNVVIFATGTLEVKANVDLTNAILVGVNKVDFKGSAIIRAPEIPEHFYPVVISGGDIKQSSSSATVYGNIYAVGNADFNPLDVHGATFANGVEIQGSSTYTDDGDIQYYRRMDGFTYGPKAQGQTQIPGSWHEIQ